MPRTPRITPARPHLFFHRRRESRPLPAGVPIGASLTRERSRFGPLYLSAFGHYDGVMGHLSKIGAASLRLVAVAGPVLLGLLIALYIGRPSPYFLATGI